MKKTPHAALAAALAKAKAANRDGILKATDLERGVKERLMAAGCLVEIIKGWYLLTRPGADGGSTTWFGGFWSFVGHYLSDRFGKGGYCLSAESSMDIHSGETTIGRQISVITKKNSNQVINLPYNTSLYLYSDAKNFPADVQTRQNIAVMPLVLALCRLPPAYYSNNPLNAEIALKQVSSVAEVSRILLGSQAVAAAGRLAGAYRAIGEPDKAAQIEGDMKAAGLALRVANPFASYEPMIVQSSRIKSPHATRIRAMWSTMREQVVAIFPGESRRPIRPDKTIRSIQDLYSQDAYHSLSIEGYQVTENLITKIATGNWDPDNDDHDKNQVNALAAKGYHDAFQSVVSSVDKVLKQKKIAGEIFESDLQSWYRPLFLPSVQAGLLKASDLAGYRNGPVYIRNSRHVPLPVGAVADAMETLFELLKEEENAAARAVLGHFVFVYIHPYMDGNGRIGRFLMNLMLVSGGYSWTVIRAEHRKDYIATLEQASVHHIITPFAKFVLSEMNVTI